MSHKCRGPNCEVILSDDVLMCRPHWFAVSKETRTLVWKWWRRYQKDPEEAREQYFAAIDKAAKEAAQ